MSFIFCNIHEYAEKVNPLFQGLADRGMAFDSAMDVVLEGDFARHQELFAHTGKHLGTLGSGIRFGDFKGKLLTLGGANEPEFGSGFERVSGGRVVSCGWWCYQNFVIHGGHYTATK
jgi:hypothetical protein